MRKLYSLVLIAAGLLIGTNSWAVNETSLGDKNYYAKWNRVCKITYYLANQAATTDSDCIELTEDQCEEWGLVQSHTQGHETELPSQYIENENGEYVDIRPDHGISGGWNLPGREKYREWPLLDGGVRVAKRDEDDILFYLLTGCNNDPS